VTDFWKPDSAYVRERRDIAKKPLSAAYVTNSASVVRLHIAPFPGFKKLTLDALTAGIIRDWQAWCVERGLSARRINAVRQAMAVAVGYAVKREEIERNPFASVDTATETPKEKGILSREEVDALVRSPLLPGMRQSSGTRYTVLPRPCNISASWSSSA
jgi:site-specific recombinase XerD